VGNSIWWFVGAMVLGIAEIFTLDLTFAMLAGGALAAGGVALLGAPLWVSIATFAVVSGLLFFLLRPFLLSKLKSGEPTVTGTAALVGRGATTVDEVTTASGRVKLNGEVWSARAVHGSAPIAPGADVTVTAIEGATAVVAPITEG
jgi:membrane protein implicated in regulation of membrane protease activity